MPVPNAGLLRGPQASIPGLMILLLASRLVAPGLAKLHCGMKSLLLSIHDRVAVVAARAMGLRGVLPSIPRTYLPATTLSAVFPSPNRSYEIAPRGVTS